MKPLIGKPFIQNSILKPYYHMESFMWICNRDIDNDIEILNEELLKKPITCKESS